MSDNNRIISEDVKELVEETQKIIIEYFQDTLGDNFDESKQNRLKQVFDSFSVISEDEATIHYYGGRCNCLDKKIQINRDINVYQHESSNGMNKKHKLMLELIHEYGHAFSNFNRTLINNYEDMVSISNYEEGMQCIFSEVVLNHYFSKNNIQAKAVSTGYGNKQNSLPRTMLYLLSENNQYNNAIGEYLLGDKKKYLEMFLPKDIVDNQKIYGNMISFDFSIEDIYATNPDKFKTLDEDSIFCSKNSLIYALWLQNYVSENILVDEFFECDSKSKVLSKYEEKYKKKVKIEQLEDIENVTEDDMETITVQSSIETISSGSKNSHESSEKRKPSITLSTASIAKATEDTNPEDKEYISETFEQWKQRMIDWGILK